eukprot:7237708-Karenia_brevis.AAC.1
MLVSCDGQLSASERLNGSTVRCRAISHQSSVTSHQSSVISPEIVVDYAVVISHEPVACQIMPS